MTSPSPATPRAARSTARSAATGIQITDLGAQDYGYDLLLHPSGDLVLAGNAGADVGLARYTTNGTLDTGFAGDGIVTTNAGGPDDVARGLALQPNDDKLVAAGKSNNDFAVLRYQGDDTTAPETGIDSGPSGFTTDTTPTFTFSSNEGGVTFACSADGGAYLACPSPYSFAALPDGAHSFRVRATDEGGNTDATRALRTFTVDTVAPQTVIESAPSGMTNDKTPTFTFSASESGASFQCLDLTATAKRTQRLKKGIALTVRSAHEASRVTVTGKLRVTQGRRLKSYSLKRVNRSLAAGKRITLRLKPSAKLRKAAARALAGRKRVTVQLTVRGTDAAGNADLVKLTVRLKR